MTDQTQTAEAPAATGAAAAALTDPAANPAAAAAAAPAAPAPAAAPAAAPWWQAPDFTAEERQWIEARGLAEDDPAKVVGKLVKGHRAAEQRLGRGIDSILDKPKDGQGLTDWMREHAEIFGIPKTLEDVKIEKPKDMPDGIAWDAGFETKARQAAFDLGLSSAQLKGMTDLYLGQVKAMEDAASAQLAAANETMMADLRKEFGDQLDAKITRARQALQGLAQAAGLDAAAVANVAQLLTDKAGGDAATVRLFAALGEAMGEDRALGLNGGGGSLGMTPAEARARAAQLRSAGGAFYEATAKGNAAEVARLRPELERLDKIAAGGR